MEGPTLHRAWGVGVWERQLAEGTPGETWNSHHLLTPLNQTVNSSNMAWQVTGDSTPLLLRVPGPREGRWAHAERPDPA